jgi:hypothetical protein
VRLRNFVHGLKVAAACPHREDVHARSVQTGHSNRSMRARRGNSNVQHPCNLRLSHRPGDHGWSYFALARLRVPAQPLVLAQVGKTAHPGTPQACLLFALPFRHEVRPLRQLSRSCRSRLRARPTASRPHLYFQIFLKSQRGASEDPCLSSRCTATLCCNLDDRFRIAAIIR